MMDTAFLSNEGCYTVFTFGENRIKFIAPILCNIMKKY